MTSKERKKIIFTEPKQWVNQVLLTGVMAYRPLIIDKGKHTSISIYIYQPVDTNNGKFRFYRSYLIKSYDVSTIEKIKELDSKAFLQIDGKLVNDVKNKKTYVLADKIIVRCRYADKFKGEEEEEQDNGNEADSDRLVARPSVEKED